MEFLPKLVLVLVSLLISSVVLDRGLGLIGFPADVSPPIAHPPDQEQVRENIEFTYTFRTNSAGLRYREIPGRKSDGSTRILVLGDSFVEGWGVEEDDRFTDRLEQLFSSGNRDIHFINAGLSGTAPLAYARLMRDVAPIYQPDGVLICVYANDVFETPPDITIHDINSRFPYRSIALKAAYRLWPYSVARVARWREQELLRRRTVPGDFIATVAAEARRRGIDEATIEDWRTRLPTDLVHAVEQQRFNGNLISRPLFNSDSWRQSLDIYNDTAEAKWQSMQAMLSEIVRMAGADAMGAALVFIPVRFQYDAASFEPTNPVVQAGADVRPDWLTEETELQRRLAAWAEHKKLPFLDLTGTLRAAAHDEPSLTYPLDGHWTPRGHRIAAGAISRWIEEQEVFRLKCQKAVSHGRIHS